jgi:hypothetical protein
VAVPPLILGWRDAGDSSKDAVELRIAAEAGVEGCLEKCALLSRTSVVLMAVEEALYALPIAKLDDRETGVLFEQPAQTRGAESAAVRELRKTVGILGSEQQADGTFDSRVHSARCDLARSLEALPGVQQSV